MNRTTELPTPLIFRVGTPVDFLECAELWMRALAFRDGTPSDPEMERSAMAKLTALGGILSIVESGSEIKGFALVRDETPKGVARKAHLALIAVDPAHQSQGLGLALLANVTQSLAAEGFAEVPLRVLRDNMSALKMYERAGWKVTGCGAFEDSGRPSLRYRLELTANDSSVEIPYCTSRGSSINH